ncbi:MAG TPA: hydrolase [Quisquiliibacterium sp.]|nr:MAG: hydrolase [Burkholderiaceae bacterium]HOA92526.1 hydrolase [Quisquiliibacterium sp.]HPA88224.1 hydrolase [Quisquiliibacterium sp.]HQD84861.1 hydrolase [Quisquiliibacterium sp.]HQN12745.1 hydrolase [Quisquiliibacterium sp.]
MPPALHSHGPGAHRFAPARWLPGGHAQTIWPAVVAPRPRVAYRRQRWTTPDGDFIDVDFVGTSARADARPLVVLFHGLEGSAQSHYARALMAAIDQAGWRGAVAHFRGCSGEPNLAPRAYHSGDSDEIDWILRRFASEHAGTAPVLAVGVSLGGNALLKWLGERGEDARIVAAAAAVSAPQDLLAGATALSRGFNRVYTRNFLATLKRKSLHKLEQHPGLFDRTRMLAARDFFGFDNDVTAPMHGFRDCYDYWARSSCKPWLAGIRVPTLVLNALNDPFLPAHALATPAQVSADVVLDYPTQGGHVGFLSGALPGRIDWLPQRLLQFFRAATDTAPIPGRDAAPRHPPPKTGQPVRHTPEGDVR